MNTANNIKWNVAHFPRGSVVEFKVGCSGDPVVGTVTDIIQNGIKSWVLVTDLPGKVTTWESYNIEHVTRIIKRGTGSYVVGNAPHVQHLKATTYDSYFTESTERLQKFFVEWGIRKSRKEYVAFDPSSIALAVTPQYTNETMLVDWYELYPILISCGAIKWVKSKSDIEGLARVCTGNKKRVKRAIKRSLKACLLNHEKAWQKQLQEEEEQYLRDIEWVP